MAEDKIEPGEEQSEQAPSESAGHEVKRIKFHYIKSNAFRVIHVDGAWGGLTPRLDIQMAIFSERQPIPLQAVQEIKADGTLGKEIREERISRDGVVREVEASLVMNLETAKGVVVWLQDKIKQIEKLAGKESDASKEGKGEPTIEKGL